MFNFAPAIPSRRDFEWCSYLRRFGTTGDAMERLLHDLGVMDHSGWADWQPSALTRTGAPTNVVFASGRRGLQITTEIDDPSKPAQDRLDKACRIMADLGHPLPQPALRDVLAAAQGAGPLIYGARLAITQHAQKRQMRLLVELPAAAADLGALLTPAISTALSGIGRHDVRLTQLACDGSTGIRTLHGTIKRATLAHLPLLAEIAQVSPDLLARAIEGLADAAPGAPLPLGDLHFALATRHMGAQPPVLTLFLGAAELLGCDARIARRIKACGGARLHGYTALLDALAPLHLPGVTHHGRIGLTARQGAMPLLSVDVAAPWTDPAE